MTQIRILIDALEAAMRHFDLTPVVAVLRKVCNCLPKAPWRGRALTPGMRRVFALVALLTVVSTNRARSQDTSTSIDTLLSQAVESENKQDYGTAGKLYSRALLGLPDDPEILKRLGLVYQREREYGKSVEIFEQILRRAPAYPQANVLLAISYYALNHFDKAIKSARRELTANPKDRQAQYYLALALHASDRNLEAIQQLEALVSDHPDDVAALYELVLFYKDGAHETSQRVAKLAPDSEWFLALRAGALADTDHLDDAIREYRAILKKNPAFPGMRFELGQVYWRKKDSEHAEAELKLSLLEDPNQPLANYYLGDILTDRKEYGDAIAHFRIAIAAYPKMTKAYFLLAKCHAGIGESQRALEFYQRALELDPDYREVHYQLYTLYARLGNKGKSQAELRLFEKLTREDDERDKKLLNDYLQKQVESEARK
jgi:tetratricopeptide (TPR) repeat protein